MNVINYSFFWILSLLCQNCPCVPLIPEDRSKFQPLKSDLPRWEKMRLTVTNLLLLIPIWCNKG